MTRNGAEQDPAAGSLRIRIAGVRHRRHRPRCTANTRDDRGLGVRILSTIASTRGAPRIQAGIKALGKSANMATPLAAVAISGQVMYLLRRLIVSLPKHASP